MKSFRKTNTPESFLNKVSGWRLATLFEKRLQREWGNLDTIYGDNNLVPFQLLWREAIPKPEKSLYVLSKIAPIL